MSRAVLFFTACAAMTAAAPALAETIYCTNITSVPITITAPGIYCLKQDVNTGITSGAAITINANNVTIDFNDYKLGGLTGGPNTMASGVYANARSNITLRNGNIRGFRTGIYLNGANGGPGSGHLVENNLLDGNTSIGIFASGAGVVVRGNRVVNTGPGPGGTLAYGIYGIFLNHSVIQDNSVSDTQSSVNARGIDLYIASAVDISRNSIATTTTSRGDAYGISATQSGRLNISENSILNTKAYLYADGVYLVDTASVIVRGNDIVAIDGDVDAGIAGSAITRVLCRDNTVVESTMGNFGCTTESGTVTTPSVP